MADCNQPNALGLMAGAVLNSQQNLESVREFSKAASGAFDGGMGAMMPPDHGAFMMGQAHHADMSQFHAPLAPMPMMPEFMHMPEMHAQHHMPHGDMVSEFERFHLEQQHHEQMAAFEQAYHQAAMPPPMAMAPHHHMMQHAAPPQAWAHEFHQQQHAQPVDYDQVYNEIAQGPQGAQQWAEDFEADEYADMDDYFRQADQSVKDAALEEAYSESATHAREAAGLGVDKAAIDRLMATADPKMRNSQFMKFLSKVSTGEIQFRDNQAVETGPQQSWADGFAAEQGPLRGEWVDDYASEADIEASKAAMAAGADQWAAEYEQQRQWQEQYGDEDYDPEAEAIPPDWVDQYKSFDWTGAMERAKNGMPMPAADPVYEFSETNPYLQSDDAITEAMRLFDAGNLAEATLAFEAVVQKSPDNADCWRLLGQCHAENEDETAAIAALLRAVELDPYNLEALLLLSVSFTNDLEQSRALGFLKAWLLHHPDYNQISQEDETKEFEEMYGGGGDQGTEHNMVTHLFMRAAQAMPNDADVLVALGVLYNISSEYDKAVATFQRAAEVRPQDASIWNKLGATQANSNRSSDAVGAYKRALEMRPNYVRALANLGIAYANQNMHHEASEAYLSSLARNPRAEHVWSYLRLSLSSMGREDLVMLARDKNLEAFRPAGFRF